MATIFLTVDSLRYDHVEYLPETRDQLQWHDHAYTTNTSTGGVFPTIFTGEFVDVSKLGEYTLLGERFTGETAGVTENRLISEKYGYDAGFDTFVSPLNRETGGLGLKERASRIISARGPAYRLASRLWNVYQSIYGSVGTIDRSFRHPRESFGDVPRTALEDREGFVWVHLMDPHHPYDPDGTDVPRGQAQAVSRRVLNDVGSDEDERLATELYRTQVSDMDETIATFLDELPAESRVVFAADHGELLGESGQWGHPGVARPELYHVPFGTRNVDWDFGDVVSMIDVPSILTGEVVGRGTPNREIAYATPDGERGVAITRDAIAIEGDGVYTHEMEPIEDPDLARRASSFKHAAGTKYDADEDDLEALGYL
jgi:hypothetical protein